MSGSFPPDTGAGAAAVEALECVEDGHDVEEVNKIVGHATAFGARDVYVCKLTPLGENATEAVEEGEDVEQIDPTVRTASSTRPGDVRVGGVGGPAGIVQASMECADVAVGAIGIVGTGRTFASVAFHAVGRAALRRRLNACVSRVAW